ncbi:MAG: PocR ligand-binding domain-containing protein [Terrisporobacter othiniensis]|uniref:PocR ligand-binding domain-containing protein n=1 Tax=Terrisporobacter petrolearius TaxID=1460447 RepID=UPI0022E88ADD|nr:PocR ligand-binding domain-containing protein [Terrisporobacter petrolearius]MDU4860996.1 PocR ligand-binding domain-containing protein [Terrisporobacter othiniensis]MDU6993574.1 PocR ligand-binding domain-containing protein [Terrisporobacter othiniensis]
MKKEKINLDQVIDFKKWQTLQDNLSLVTNMAIITVDYKGNPISKHSKCSRFCQSVRNHPQMVKYCQKCDSRGGLEAVRSNEPYIYLCHYNIVDVAVPIIIDGRYMGAIMAGQVKLSDNYAKDMEKIVDTSNDPLSIEVLEQYKKYYEQLPLLTYEEVQNIANMLSSLCNYLVEEALDKNLILEMYKKSIGSNKEIDEDFFQGYSVDNIEKLKKGISNAMIDAYVSQYECDKKISSTLKPAIDYIYKNKSENITVENMAKVCHISQSYFSRLFSKEMGDSFSNYISKLKINWAKELLEESDMSVSQVSDELGFNEPGYFIKIFKKHEGVTPSVYRKYYKNM